MKFKNKAEQNLSIVQKLIAKDGAKGWNVAKETLLQQKTDNIQLRQALAYLTLIPDFFRPAVVSYCCEAVGGEPAVTVPTSASLILFAKAIGIHDDIIDNVKKRKKHITVFGRFGKEVALVLSDILLFKGFTLLRKNLEIGVSPTTLRRILETIDHVWFEQSESEIFEQQSRADVNVLPEKCLTKINKRASEFEVVTRIGAILGEAPQKDIEALASYGRLTGTASLLRDELIDMLELDVLKHRIRKESLPLPIVYALQDTAAKSKIIPLISQGKAAKQDLIELTKTVDMFNGLNYVANLINDMVYKACSCVQGFHKKDKLLLIANTLRIDQREWKQVLDAM
ncbi:MAG: polyprenyl synthetase family protein [Candidatus Bathyarchaeia archaeon]